MSSNIKLPLPIPVSSQEIKSEGIETSSTTTVIKSLEVTFNDNVIILNHDEIGSGITKSPPIGGFEIHRGLLPNFRFVFNESNQNIEAGIIGDLKTVALIDDVALNAIPKWNGSKLVNGLSATQVSLLNNIDQNLASNANPNFNSLSLATSIISINNQTYQFPANSSSVPNAVLVNNGSGILNWTTINGVNGSFNTLNSNDNTSYATCQSNSFTIGLNNAPVLTVSNNNTTVSNNFRLSKGIRYNHKIITTNPYTVTNEDAILKWNGPGDLVINLSSASYGQYLIIENISLGTTITINASFPNLLNGTLTPAYLSDQYDFCELLGDGTNNWMVM